MQFLPKIKFAMKREWLRAMDTVPITSEEELRRAVENDFNAYSGPLRRLLQVASNKHSSNNNDGTSTMAVHEAERVRQAHVVDHMDSLDCLRMDGAQVGAPRYMMAAANAAG